MSMVNGGNIEGLILSCLRGSLEHNSCHFKSDCLLIEPFVHTKQHVIECYINSCHLIGHISGRATSPSSSWYEIFLVGSDFRWT